MKMTDEQVVEVLANRGCRWSMPDEGYYVAGQYYGKHLPPYLTSHDALRPVLLSLTEDEQCALDTLIWDKRWRKEGPLLRSVTWLLTLPVADLARMVAEVLSEGKEQ